MASSESPSPQAKQLDPVAESADIVPESAEVDNVGGLSFQEYTKGGMGRHLGIVSTTFLV